MLRIFLLSMTLLWMSGCNESSTPSSPATAKTLPAFFSELNVGFGDRFAFPFEKNDSSETWLSGTDLINDANLSSYYALKDYNATAFSTLQSHLKKSRFLVYWITKGWENHYWHDSKTQIQTAMNAGFVPVFHYWYFGDTLVETFPNDGNITAYYEDAVKLKDFLDDLNGTKLLIMEPEFNKPKVFEKNASFISIMRTAIDKIAHSGLYVGLGVMDAGARNAGDVGNCGYENCALGDKSAWEKPDVIIKGLSDKLDFIAFSQMVAQFSRDPQNPGTWDVPIRKTYTDAETGIASLHTRILNWCTYHKERYNKPLMLSYSMIATATHNTDLNTTNITGWETQAQNFYTEFNATKNNLKNAGLFGYAPMMLFDDPKHDAGGYQYFMENEYRMGIIASENNTTHNSGALRFKGTILEALY